MLYQCMVLRRKIETEPDSGWVLTTQFGCRKNQDYFMEVLAAWALEFSGV